MSNTVIAHDSQQPTSRLTPALDALATIHEQYCQFVMSEPDETVYQQQAETWLTRYAECAEKAIQEASKMT